MSTNEPTERTYVVANSFGTERCTAYYVTYDREDAEAVAEIDLVDGDRGVCVLREGQSAKVGQRLWINDMVWI